jgi:hypothetical protein
MSLIGCRHTWTLDSFPKRLSSNRSNLCTLMHRSIRCSAIIHVYICCGCRLRVSKTTNGTFLSFLGHGSLFALNSNHIPKFIWFQSSTWTSDPQLSLLSNRSTTSPSCTTTRNKYSSDSHLRRRSPDSTTSLPHYYAMSSPTQSINSSSTAKRQPAT